jgi:hypothetical protein
LSNSFVNRRFRCLSIFLIVTYLAFIPQQARANPLALAALDSGFMVGTGETALTALGIAAGPALLVVSACLAAGVIYHNRQQIKDLTVGALDYLTKSGEGLGKGILDLGNGAASMTADAKSTLLQYLQKCKTSPPKTTIPLINSMTIKARSSLTLLTMPVNVGLMYRINLMQTGNSIIDNLHFTYQMQGYSQTWTGSSADIISFDGNKLRTGNDSYSFPSYGNLVIGVTNYGSFDTDFGISQQVFPDASICTDVGSVYDNPVFGGATAVKTIPASNTMTWDDVIGMTKADVGTKVKVSDPAKDTTDTPPNDYTMPDSSVSLDFSPLKSIDLSAKFPFCIPFDLVNSIKALSVEAKAPKWTINFDNKYFVGGGSFDIDFATFEKWAVIIRWGILVLFVFALIVITRRMIGS